jgi:hypothetical protein
MTHESKLATASSTRVHMHSTETSVHGDEWLCSLLPTERMPKKAQHLSWPRYPNDGRHSACPASKACDLRSVFLSRHVVRPCCTLRLTESSIKYPSIFLGYELVYSEGIPGLVPEGQNLQCLSNASNCRLPTGRARCMGAETAASVGPCLS